MEEIGNGCDAPNRSEDVVDAIKLFEKSNKVEGEEEPRKSRSDSQATPSDPFRYRMDYPCMGTCLIINNKNFHPKTGMSTRTGTNADATNVAKTFSKLGYKVRLLNDQTVSEMKREMFKVAQEDHSQNASFVCVLLSHGEEGVIYGVDGCENIESLIRYIKGERCRSLVGKPKLFFIQACRGSLLDSGVESDAAIQSGTTERIPVEADYMYAYSAAPGYYSWRNTSNGSWFIQALCEALLRFRGELELMQIMTRVNHKVAFDFESASNLPGFDGMKQIPCVVSMLTKDFYFPK